MSPAGHFKQFFDEAILWTGPVDRGRRDRENREIALGLAVNSVNWGIRFLPAYAMECDRLTVETGRKDLAWVAGLVSTPA